MSNKKHILEDLSSNRFQILETLQNTTEQGAARNARPNFSQSISDSSEESNTSTGSSQLDIKSNLDELDSEANDNWQTAKPKKRQEKPPATLENLNNKSFPEILPQRPSNPEAYNFAHIELVRSLVEKNIKTLVIMRGCPGSGKSTLAR
jgi:hypothetical protein